MRNRTIFLLLLLISGSLNAQQRDLKYYLEKAEMNSPLINKNKNDNKLINLDLQQISAMLSKPEINFEASMMLAPIIYHDNGTNRFQLASEGANKYNGYDLATTDGGAYQAF